MAHLQKYTRSASGQLCQHYERKKLPSGEYVKFGNEDIDPTRTPLNYNLAPDRSLKGQIEFINERCNEVKCLNRKDVNVMCSWVITQPKEFPDNLSREFFEQTYKFLNSRYGGYKQGEQNVISAYVHLDEKSSHIHYAFVPVVHDMKTGKQKVSAKEVITKRDLLTFHKDLEKHLFEHFGFEVGIVNGATKEGNLSIKALKLKSEVEGLTEEKNKVESELIQKQGELQGYKDLEVAVCDIDNIGSKNLLSKNISVPPDELALLKEQAKAYSANKETIVDVQEQRLKLEKDRESAADEWLYANAEKRDYKQKSQELESEKSKVRREYNKQLNLNAKYEELEDEAITLRRTNYSQKQEHEKTVAQLTAQHQADMKRALEAAQNQHNIDVQTEKKKNADLINKNDHLEGFFSTQSKIINELKETCRGAYESLTHIVKAVGMLKYSNGDYKAELTPKQSILIDGIAAYGAGWAKDDGFSDLAKEINENVGISKGIQENIDELTPKQKVKSKGKSL